MALTAQQMIESYKEDIQDSKESWNQALEKRDYGLAASNLRSLFTEHLMIGLLHWRQGQDPSVHFRDAIEGLFKNFPMIEKTDLNAQFTPLMPFDISLYLAYLLESAHPPVSLESLNDHVVPDAFFANVLVGTAKIADWPQYANRLPQDERYLLAHKTYNLYAGLLTGRINIEQGIRLGEELYSQRKEDDYFSDSPGFEGGSGYNVKVVDFRLAAILKKIGSTIPTIHAWKW